MDNLYSSFSDLTNLEKEKQSILDIFEQIKTGLKELNNLGVKLSGSSSAKQVNDLTVKTDELTTTITKQSTELAKLIKKAEDLTSEEGKRIEGVKAANNLIQSQNKEEQKANVIRQEAYTSLIKQRIANKELNDQRVLRIKLAATEEGTEKRLTLQYQKATLILSKLNQAQKDSPRGAALQKFAADTKKNLDAAQQASGNFKGNVGNYANSLADGFQKVSREIARLQTEAKKLRDDGDPAGAERIAGQIRKLDQVIKVSFDGNKTYDQSVKAINNSFRDLAHSGEFSKEFLSEFKEFAVESKKSAKDLGDEIKRLSSDTRNLDLASGALSTLASGFEGIYSAASLAGAGSEETEKALQKLVAVQGVANSIRETAKQITEKGTAANKIYNYVIQQGTVLFGKGSTAAQRFGAAMKGILIVAIIGFLIKFIQYLVDFEDKAEDAKASLEKLNDELERNRNLIKDLSESDAAQFKNNLEDLKRAGIEKLKLAKNDKEAAKVTQQNRLAEFKLEEKFRKDQIQKLYIQQKRADELVVDQEFQKSNYLREAQKAGLTTISKDRKEAYDESIKAAKKNSKDIADAIKSGQRDLILLQKGNLTEMSQEELDALKARQEQIKQDNENEKKAALDLLKFRQGLIAQQKEYEASQDSVQGTSQKVQAAIEESKALKKIVDAQQEYDLSAERLTKSQIKLINATAAQERIDIENKLQRKILDIRTEALAKERQQAQDSSDYFDEISNQRLEAEKNADAKARDEIQKNAEIARDEALKQNADNFEAGLKTKEEYEEKKLEIEKRFQIQSFEGLINQAKLERAILKAKGADTKALDAEIANAEAVLAQTRIESAKAVEDATKVINKSIKDNYYETFKNIEEIITNVYNGIAAARVQSLETEKDQIDINKAAEIERINKTTDSEEKKAARIKLIETKAQIDKENIERRQRAIQRQAAIFERAFKAFQITTDNIQAVNKARNAYLVAPPPLKPLYLSQLILTISSGVASLTALLGSPLPKYYTGTESSAEGPAHLAERGRELSVDKRGKLRLWEKPTIGYLTKGTKVYNNSVTEKLLAGIGEMNIKATGDIDNRPINVNVGSDDRVVNELRSMSKKQGIIIYNSTGVESTAYYINQMKW